MWLGKSLVRDRPSWHKEPINFLNKMLSIRKVRLLITSRYNAMQSYECVIISKMFLIYFLSSGCNGGALVFLWGAEASASPSFALPMFITIKKKKNSASVFRCASYHCRWHRHTLAHPWLRPWGGRVWYFNVIWLKSIHTFTFIVTVFTASASIRVSARNASL